ncbi:MAG: hypothetical protein JXB19_00360, partial [Bacteroidales bacterium]|nr:hypothetical protein [Bacteroidales bacterium]
EQGFAYNYERVKVHERIGNMNSNVERTLAYTVPAVERSFAFNIEMAETAERLESQHLALQRSLKYEAPADSDNITMMTSNDDTGDRTSGLYSLKGIKVTWPVVASIKPSY